MRKWQLVVDPSKRLSDFDYQEFDGKLYYTLKETVGGVQERDPVWVPLQAQAVFEPSCCEGSKSKIVVPVVKNPNVARRMVENTRKPRKKKVSG